MDKEKSEFGRWWVWVLLLIVISLIVLSLLRAGGLIGQTVLERVVFEQSFQKQAGDNAKLSVFKAQEASIQVQLRRSDLSQSQRADFEAQLAAIRIQIQSVE